MWTSEKAPIFSVLTVVIYSEKKETDIVGSENMDKKPSVIYTCKDGVNRTMEEIGELTQRGIKTSVTVKTGAGRPQGSLVPPHVLFPKRFTGGGWVE